MQFQHGAHHRPARALERLAAHGAKVAAVAAGKEANGLDQKVVEHVAVVQQLGQNYLQAQVERLAAQLREQGIYRSGDGHKLGGKRTGER